MKITIITVGKLKEKYLKDAIAEYTKRLSKSCKLEIIEVADEKTPDQASVLVENGIRRKEGERILKHIKEGAYVITLEINGKLLSSEEFSEKIEQLGIQGKSHISFRKVRLCIEFLQNDFSASTDACYFAGTDLSCISDYRRSTVS